jgi:hypothetical protein
LVDQVQPSTSHCNPKRFFWNDCTYHSAHDKFVCLPIAHWWFVLYVMLSVLQVFLVYPVLENPTNNILFKDRCEPNHSNLHLIFIISHQSSWQQWAWGDNINDESMETTENCQWVSKDHHDIFRNNINVRINVKAAAWAG